MRLNGVEIEDTFAEAFKMRAGRLIITAVNEKWAVEAARRATGFATSVIGCGCEAGIEKTLSPGETPDGFPGVSILLFAIGKANIEEHLLLRVGQCIMTCPTTACFNGLESGEKLNIGGKIRFFGDGDQISKLLEGKDDEGRRLWRIPVMDGEFLIEESFSITSAIGGGNFLILGRDSEVTLEAAEKAVAAMEGMKGVVLPFPGGIVRSGSKTGSKYKFLSASTNTPLCPTLKHLKGSQLPEAVNSVLEIVIDGLTGEDIRETMRVGIQAACIHGIVRITAGNYGGTLGKFQFHLHEIMG
ncbi:Formyltransferase/hydrolase complex subunit D [subsurface metagenome]